MWRPEPSLTSKSISASRQSWSVVRPLTVSAVPSDSSQLLRRKVVPDHRKHRENPSAALSHLRLPLLSWDLGIRQKRQSLRSLPFSSRFHFPVCPYSSGSSLTAQVTRVTFAVLSDTHGSLERCKWGRRKLVLTCLQIPFMRTWTTDHLAFLCSYHLTTLKLPYGFHSGSFVAKSYYTHTY